MYIQHARRTDNHKLRGMSLDIESRIQLHIDDKSQFYNLTMMDVFIENGHDMQWIPRLVEFGSNCAPICRKDFIERLKVALEHEDLVTEEIKNLELDCLYEHNKNHPDFEYKTISYVRFMDELGPMEDEESLKFAHGGRVILPTAY